ncbi:MULTISPECIES: exopolysaccharide biosynthesis protein [Oleiagrimonas]|uniref:Exopolysaccharide biosynthesis protein n=1 Tax=Oleiagrimonas citrea TaxID=1665687 RepID=A0A846ZN21_9GAMM|nr:exopolysaccharide biosynthesis protein [Oleiagrimonas sp. MCCC 1A03011]NKZ39695.1 exopolysaccharide biosynthesis protein [Oleiagrimonas citrea]RAP59350.1 hypothetical protein BTJ49_01400 [Oleiagrimonas sp. MCCC 1A03011]
MNPGERRTTRILAETLAAHEDTFITLDTLLAPLRARAFGCVLLLLAIPNFIPAPLGIGGIMGSMIIVLGLQMMIGMEQPWMPKRLRERPLRCTSVHKFLDRTLPILQRLERMCRPRLELLTQRPVSIVTGVFLTLLGILLALPIPFTNYFFGLIMLAYAIALIERDGALLVGLWVLSVAILVLSVVFSSVVLDAMAKMF